MIPLGRTLFVLAVLPAPVAAQVTLIPHGTQAQVVEALKTDLSAQGFALDHVGKHDALYTLDRGNVIQNNGMVVHEHLEIKVSFKTKKEGLEVVGTQDVVGEASGGMDFRKPMDTPSEIASFQHLLDSVRDSIEARAARNSTPARDSTH